MKGLGLFVGRVLRRRLTDKDIAHISDEDLGALWHYMQETCAEIEKEIEYRIARRELGEEDES